MAARSICEDYRKLTQSPVKDEKDTSTVSLQNLLGAKWLEESMVDVRFSDSLGFLTLLVNMSVMGLVGFPFSFF